MNNVLLNREASNNTDSNYFVERRRRKRCPECQFFIAVALILLGSLVVSVLVNLLPGLMNKSDFQVSSASSFERQGAIAIDADLKMNFPIVVVDALENGIPLTIAIDVQLLRDRIWWRNIIIKESRLRFELRYHPLTNVHEVRNIATGERYTFNSRQDAMAVLGTIRGAHLIDKKELSKTDKYYVQMRILLDISRLPHALRQVASLSPSWRLESPWFFWIMNDKPRSQAKIAEVEQSDLTVELKRKGKMPDNPPVESEGPPEPESQPLPQAQAQTSNNASDKPHTESDE